MKKIFILLLFVLASCSSDTVTEPVVINAMVATEMRIVIINYDTLVTISDTGYLPHGELVFYSNNANDCGRKLVGSETDHVGTLTNGIKVQQTISYKRYVVCN
ncbi:hypothetical protein QO200_19030 [Flavobacterium sp. Arc3]|uniref:hypothetical protein n=1 Tax=Flavobacterium sp. Arc3 TaxID=3046686 RepID=UPI00352F5E65